MGGNLCLVIGVTANGKSKQSGFPGREGAAGLCFQAGAANGNVESGSVPAHPAGFGLKAICWRERRVGRIEGGRRAQE
jgi:hypothetical protein